MNAVIGKISALVTEELKAANTEHSAFHSAHEGWAVLKEEVEEAHDDLIEVERMLLSMWQCVKRDDLYAYLSAAKALGPCAEHLAAEAIQVAAMARKFIASVDGGGVS